MNTVVDKISVIVPCFNEQDNVEKFYTQISGLLKSSDVLKFNILFVDDGSVDNTLKIIKNLAEKNDYVKYISLSKNFGKESAIYAGLFYAKKFDSQYFLLMDADLQDPPELINQMISTLNKNKSVQCVCACRKNRKGEPFIRSALSKMFYKIINSVSSIELNNGARDFRLMTKKYVDAVLQCGEYNRFFKGITSWIGFKVKWLEYENAPRETGKSKWSFFSLFKYSLEAIIAFTTWPLTILVFVGLIMSFLSMVALLFVVIRAATFGDPVAGWPSLTCIILLIGSLILFSFGILGLYFEKMYLEIKKRPIYIVDEDNF